MLRFAHGPATLRLGDFEVCRFGYGAMRLTGEDGWGEPADPAAARAVLRRAVELGVDLIDTAGAYGPRVANRLIAEALHPYPSDLVISTRVGVRRGADRSWLPALGAASLRAAVDDDLRDLRLDQLPIVHLRWSDQPEVPFEAALDSLLALQREGKIRHLALAHVTAAQLVAALERTPIACVQNLFNLTGARPEGETDPALAICEARGIAFLPVFPIPLGRLATTSGALAAAAGRHNCTPAQLALAWLLARSPVILPVPGTCQVVHLEENMGAIHVALEPGALDEIAPNR